MPRIDDCQGSKPAAVFVRHPPRFYSAPYIRDRKFPIPYFFTLMLLKVREHIANLQFQNVCPVPQTPIQQLSYWLKGLDCG